MFDCYPKTVCAHVCVHECMCVCVEGSLGPAGTGLHTNPPPPNLVTRVGLAENNKVMVGGRIWGRNPGNHLAHRECHLLYSSTKRAKPHKRSHKPEKTGFRKHRV